MLLSFIDHPPSATDDVTFGGSSCGVQKRRPDTLWIGEDRVVSIEIDEKGGHPDRDPSCEMAKMQDQATAFYALLGKVVPIFYLRFNPDESGCGTSLDDRVRRVSSRVNTLLSQNLTDIVKGDNHLRIHVEYHFYHEKCTHHIDAVREDDAFQIVECNTQAT